MGAVQIAARSKRRTVRIPDLLEAIHSTSTLAFLREDFPEAPPRQKVGKTIAEAAAAQGKRAPPPATGKSSITSFFGAGSGRAGGADHDRENSDALDNSEGGEERGGGRHTGAGEPPDGNDMQE